MRLLTAPTAEPVTLDEVKFAARLTGSTAFDTMLPVYIQAAREIAETEAGRKLMAQVWRIELADWPHPCQVFELHSATAVTVGVLHLDRQLGKGLAKFGDEHHRIKTKAVGATPFGGDLACHAAHRNQWLWVIKRAQRDQGADHGGSAVGEALHLFQQSRDVVVVAFFIAKAGGVVGRIHTGLATKSVHTQAGIVGQRRQA
mgnify:CR=1 FL=1